MNHPTGNGSGERREVLLTFAVAVTPSANEAERVFRRRMLAATLASLFGQTDGAFRVMVAGARRDAADLPTDPRLEFVPFESLPARNRPAAHLDQATKLLAMAQLMAARGGGYFMPVDMDDFVSRDLVAFTRAHPDPNGYIIDKGYALDGRTNHVSLAYAPGAPHGVFNKACGTSAIVNLARGDLPPALLSHPLLYPAALWAFYQFRRWGRATGPRFRYLRLRERGHYMTAEAAIAEGRPLLPVPFPAAVYTVLHGGNLSLQAREASRHAMRRRLSDMIQTEGFPSSRIAAEFNLPAAYPLPGAPQA
jgi:hypothetical protein